METQQQNETTEHRGDGSDSTGLVMPHFPRLKMVEIYGGKDDKWKGWHNLILELSEDAGDSKPIQGPIDPQTSQEILESMRTNEENSIEAGRYRKLRAKHWHDGGITVVEEASSIKLGCQTLSLERLDDALDAEA